MNAACAMCGCICGAATHAIVAALATDDLDAAVDAGLLEATPCEGCSDACNALLIAARDTRRRALAARERYRARQARLQRRAQARVAARAPAAGATAAPAATPGPALPAAAAAALERAKARAAARRRP